MPGTSSREKGYATSERRGGRGASRSADLGHGSRKRKFDQSDYDGSERQVQRARIDNGEPFMDEAWVRRQLPFPTKAEYPNAPGSLFTDAVIVALHNIGNNELRMAHNVAPTRGGFRAVVSGTLFDGTDHSAVGMGRSKVRTPFLRVCGHVCSPANRVVQQKAIKAGTLHWVALLHKSGELKNLFSGDVLKLDKETLQEEGGAMTDIYNYAARFSLVPEVAVRSVGRAVRSGRGGKMKSQLEVTIRLPDQGIEVSGRSNTYKTASVIAAIKFKAEAEQYHAEHSEESLVIRDSTALNASNVKSFLEYCGNNHKTIKLDAIVKPLRNPTYGPEKDLWQAQPKLNEQEVLDPVVFASKKQAEAVALLVAAVSASKDEPSLADGFTQALTEGNGAYIPPIRPIDMEIDHDAILIMEQALYDARKMGLPDVRDRTLSDEDFEGANKDRHVRQLDSREKALRSELLSQRFKDFNNNPSLANLLEKKEALPMSQHREEVLRHIENNVYSVVVGATGSGKTTQVPQILLESAITKSEGANCNIICTQPRRIAATSVARRVAEERNESLGDTVGYAVRFDSKRPQLGGSITYCTTGILLKQLQNDPDSLLDSVSHIVIDEVHERDILIDFLLIIIKKNFRSRVAAGKSLPRVVLMSATIDSELFAKYFGEKRKDGSITSCPSLSIPGRTFPVKEKYFQTISEELAKYLTNGGLNRVLDLDKDSREYMRVETSFKAADRSNGDGLDGATDVAEATIDWKKERIVTADGVVVDEREDALVPVALVAATISHIAQTSTEGAVLVFLPGFDEIKKVNEILQRYKPLGVDFQDSAKFRIHLLHSSVPAAEQAEAFKAVPEGCRKIILSTNIAETSVTIPDIQYVVDTGKLREKRYDQVRRITKLQCTWVSKSNAKQRAGRAGRVQNGNYYALFSRARYESLRAIGLPEMLRSDLQEICLDIKAQAFKTPIRAFLADAIEPPPPAAVDASVRNLISLEALTTDEKLTALGRLLAKLPVHPSLGKMIVLGVIFRCLDPMIILGAGLAERSLFVSPHDKRQQATAAQARFLEGSESDHYALINAFRQMRRLRQTKGQQALFEFSMNNFCHIGAHKSIEGTCGQIEEVLIEAGLIPQTRFSDRVDSEFGHPSLNKNSHNVTVIKALALAGLHPNLGVCLGQTLRTPGERAARLHPSSLNAPKSGRYDDIPIDSLFIYSTMNKGNDGNQIFLRDTTLGTPLMATLFGGRLDVVGNVIRMDGWLPMYVKASTRVVKTILEFRKALDRLLSAAFQELSELRTNRERGIENYLADDGARETFASGLVEVLGKDIYRPLSRGGYKSSRRGTSDGGRGGSYASAGSYDGAGSNDRGGLRNGESRAMNEIHRMLANRRDRPRN